MSVEQIYRAPYIVCLAFVKPLMEPLVTVIWKCNFKTTNYRTHWHNPAPVIKRDHPTNTLSINPGVLNALSIEIT